MKILQLCFRNLNSLQGTWSIDFTAPPYASDGIFLITGPTGAGKSTILDAVCIALYGQTPRLGRLTKSSNEIMSRMSGDCFAEVTFETDAGMFRCHWSQHRSRRQPDGELQNPRHEISDVHTGKVIESKMRDVLLAIEERTGMDFDRFTRSMLLAQGSFAVFLQSDADKRAPVLEQITGTEIYSEISRRVHERSREEKNHLQLKRTELETIDMMGESERCALEEQINEDRRSEKQLLERLKKEQQALQWLHQLRDLNEERVSIERESRELVVRRERFEPSLQRLNRAEKASHIEGMYRELLSLREEQEEARSARDEAAALLPPAEERCDASAKAVNDAVRQHAEHERLLKGSRKLFSTVRLLDSRIADAHSSLDTLKTRHAGLRAKADDFLAAIASAEQERQRVQEHLTASAAYLEANACDKALVSELSTLLELFGRCNAFVFQLREAEEASEVARKHQLDLQQEKETIDEKVRKASSALEEASCQQQQLYSQLEATLDGRSLPEWRNEAALIARHEALFDAATIVAASLKDLRQQHTICKEKIINAGDLLSKTVSGIAESETLREQLQQEVLHLEERVRLESRIRDLEDERSRLVKGRPCPLCGSLHHPLVQATLPFHDDTATSLDSARRELKTLDDKIAGQKLLQAGYEKDRIQAEERLGQIVSAIASDLERFEQYLPLPGFPGDNAEPSIDAISLARAAVEERAEMTARVLGKAESIEEQLKRAGDRHGVLRDSLLALKSQAEKAGYRKEQALDELGRAEELVAKCIDDKAACDERLITLLKPYRVKVETDEELSAVPDILRSKHAAWDEENRRKELHERQLHDIDAFILQQHLLLDALQTDIAEQDDEISRMKKDICELEEGRLELFDRKDVDRQEALLDERLAAAAEEVGRRQDEHAAVNTSLQEIRHELQTLDVSMLKRHQRLAAMSEQFRSSLHRSGFHDENDFSNARLTQEERESLLLEEKKLNTDASLLDLRSAACVQKHETLVSKNLTSSGIEEVEHSMADIEEEIRERGKRLGALEQRLQDDDLARSRQKEKADQIASLVERCRLWEQMYELIGSADGKKYRNFVQSLTFEMVIVHANRQLIKMTDRYFLVPDRKNPLDLNVVDNYQGGEVRSTRNLSGGESFIVSLALALGLSSMSSRKVRVDSLFLDEGFGTLDEDSLETALEALSGLQQTGKLIGIISHVAVLRDRLTTQVFVRPLSGGKSSLDGPGVTPISR